MFFEEIKVIFIMNGHARPDDMLVRQDQLAWCEDSKVKFKNIFTSSS